MAKRLAKELHALQGGILWGSRGVFRIGVNSRVEDEGLLGTYWGRKTCFLL